MKRKILSLVLALVLSIAFVPGGMLPAAAAYTIPGGSIIQDPAFYEAVIDLLPDKTLGDTIAAGDVASFDELDVTRKGIADLTGIEHFTKLRYLLCGSNELTVLDVSKNTELLGIQCFDNKLTALNVSGDTKLEWLQCFSNELTALDVSKNTKLTTLDCGNNKLTELDVSNNTALESLYCYFNQLTELDISKNTALEGLSCFYNYMADYSAVTGFSGTWDDSNFIFTPQRTPNPLDTASDWARPNITAAIEKGFVPTDIQDNYKSTITRAEFCRLAVMWLEYKLGESIDAIVEEHGYPERMELTFTDTDDPNILAAYRLGVTSGTDKPGIFNPNGQFTRQEAATMIMNTCKAAGFDVTGIPPADFKDLDSVPLWAQPGVNFVRANGIMNGDGTNFNPTETFSREQSIITFNNIK